MLGQTLTNLTRLNRMINTLSDVSQIEAGKLELESSRIDLGELVRGVASSDAPLARERGMGLAAIVGAGPTEATVERDKICEVLNNPIHNALKFTRQGRVEIAARRQADEICCSVTDTGSGIPPEMLPKVFGKFQQFGGPAAGREKGSGLGLSLCK